MHTEHDALPVVAGNGDSSLFVAATLAALALAGSALVYRKIYDSQPAREKLTQPLEHPTSDNMDTEKNLSLGVNRYADGVSSTHDPDSKESRSSRSKDRRRRGKDPLKEILKGGKKMKSTTATPIKQLFTRKPILDDLSNISAPSAPASSTRNSAPNSPSRGSGKRTQHDNSIFFTAPVDSRTTPEVSPNKASNIPDLPHPRQRTRDRSSSISDHHVLNPSQSSSSSSSSIEDNTSISDGQNLNILSRQTRETHLPEPILSIFSTIIQNTDDFSEIVNRSLPSSASSPTATTTTSCVITPATSPSLSSTSSKLVPAPAAPAPNRPKNHPLSADLSHALGAADTESGNISRKQYPQTPPKSKSKTSVPNPWDWGNTGEVSPSSSSFSVSVITSAPTSSLIAAPAFSLDTLYRKPPRLQPKSLWSKKAKNGASSSIPGSVSHPSLLSPTSGSFVPSDSALLSPSISLSLEKLPNRVFKDKGGENESEEEPADDTYTQLEFPTLNPIVSSSSSLASSTANSSAGPSNILRPTTPRRAHSSRGPPTPSGSTPPPPSNSGSAQPPSTPAVSTQTQLASLRGALEAARLREDKNKAELERYIKELEAVRWENANSKRGEVELQNHIRHLMHQIQIYSSLFASLAPQPASQPQPLQQTQGPMADGAGLPNPGDRTTSGPGPGNGPTTTPSPCTQNIQSPVIPGLPASSPPMHPHMLPPLQLNGLFSPSSVHAPSPYIPYPIPLPSQPHSVMPSPHPLFAQQFHHMQRQFLQFQQYQHHQMGQGSIFQAQQGNPFSMMRQPSLANISYSASSSSMASGSRSSSRPGTESAESSPDLNGSLSPGSGSNRKATRTTQIANGYVGVRAGGKGTGENWVVGGVGIDEGHEDESIHESEVQGENGDGDEDEGGFNEILADAILKRPDRIGVRSGKKTKQILLEKEKEKEEGKDKDRQQEHNVLDVVEPLTEFKFPSLSDLGNVYYGGHNQSSSSLSVVVSSKDSGPNVFDLPQPVDRPSQDVEAIVPQNWVGRGNRNENENENQPTVGSSSESERTPRREELESNITELLMDLHGTEEAANVKGQ